MRGSASFRRCSALIGLVVGLILATLPGIAVAQAPRLDPTPVPATPTPTTAPESEAPPGEESEETAEASEPEETEADAPPEVDSEAEAETPAPQPAAPAVAYPVPDDQPADYPLAQGHFYSQAVPGAPRGFGFAVNNAASIPFWSEYQRLGGLGRLGYPISRRFVREGDVSQAFQQGILRWRSQQRQAEIVQLTQGERLPQHAVQPEPPARLASWAAHQPWSGWWWPASSGTRGPYLIDPNGPLAKYDRFVTANGLPDPGTLAWERSELWLAGYPWAGHCNGWAAAALLEKEPSAPIEIAGQRFSVADQKGLLSAYHFADGATWLDGGEGVSPLALHQRLVTWLGGEKKGFIFTFRPSQDDEVWSYPVYRFELTMSPDPLQPDVTHVQATVWLSDNDVPADFVGVRPWKGEGQVYEYRLTGPSEAPTGGEWEGISLTGRFTKPSVIWYPDPKSRNIDRQLSSPELKYEFIEKIVGKR